MAEEEKKDPTIAQLLEQIEGLKSELGKRDERITNLEAKLDKVVELNSALLDSNKQKPNAPENADAKAQLDKYLKGEWYGYCII